MCVRVESQGEKNCSWVYDMSLGYTRASSPLCVCVCVCVSVMWQLSNSRVKNKHWLSYSHRIQLLKLRIQHPVQEVKKHQAIYIYVYIYIYIYMYTIYILVIHVYLFLYINKEWVKLMYITECVNQSEYSWAVGGIWQSYIFHLSV